MDHLISDDQRSLVFSQLVDCVVQNGALLDLYAGVLFLLLLLFLFG